MSSIMAGSGCGPRPRSASPFEGGGTAGGNAPAFAFMGRIGRGCDARGMRRPHLLLLPLLAMLAPGAAQACSMLARPNPTPAEAQAAARLAIDQAAAIVDGEVIRAFIPGRSPALVRVHRRFKGPDQAEVQVGMLTSCDVALMRLGERQRMILAGGPDIYFIRMGVGGDGVAVDALLGSDRRVDWPYVQGVWAGPTP